MTQFPTGMMCTNSQVFDLNGEERSLPLAKGHNARRFAWPPPSAPAILIIAHKF